MSPCGLPALVSPGVAAKKNPFSKVSFSKMSGRKRKDFDTKEKIIKAVYSREPLWNRKLKAYRDRVLVYALWQEVSQEVNRPKEDCKRLWKNLQDHFRNTLHEQLTKSGPADDFTNVRWRFFHKMMFLKDLFEERRSSRKLTLQILKPVELPTEQALCEQSSTSGNEFNFATLKVEPTSDSEIISPAHEFEQSSTEEIISAALDVHSSSTSADEAPEVQSSLAEEIISAALEFQLASTSRNEMNNSTDIAQSFLPKTEEPKQKRTDEDNRNELATMKRLNDTSFDHCSAFGGYCASKLRAVEPSRRHDCEKELMIEFLRIFDKYR